MPAALRSKTLAGFCCAFALRATIGKAKVPERRICLSILNCVIRIFYVQRYKMKIVQYCRMLRKLAILYDSEPIILLPFYPLRISDAAELRRTQPKGTGWRRANYRGRASAKQAKRLALI